MAAAIVVLSGCGGNPEPVDGAAGPSSEPTASSTAERSSQPLETAVIDLVALVDGPGATRLMDVTLWVADHRQEECGGQGSFMQEGDRYDQTMFPDFDVIASEGLGVGRVSVEPEPESRPVDDACMATTLPEIVETDKVFGEWMDAVVYPAWASAEVAASADESAACLRDAMGFDDPGVTLDTFLPAVDGVVAGWGDLSREEFDAKVANLDRQASEALAACTKDTYELFSSRLREERAPFLDRHNETIAAAVQALDEAGYTP